MGSYWLSKLSLFKHFHSLPSDNMFFGENLSTIEAYIVQNHQELVILLHGGIRKHLCQQPNLHTSTTLLMLMKQNSVSRIWLMFHDDVHNATQCYTMFPQYLTVPHDAPQHLPSASWHSSLEPQYNKSYIFKAQKFWPHHAANMIILNKLLTFLTTCPFSFQRRVYPLGLFDPSHHSLATQCLPPSAVR